MYMKNIKLDILALIPACPDALCRDHYFSLLCAVLQSEF
jgi:hypothetical protein